MPTLALKLTDAGLAAVQGASGADPVTISELGLTATPFDYAPTLTALPGEFKRVAITSGTAAAPNITHLTAYDTTDDSWEVTGFGLFMADDVLFAVYTADEVFMTKSSLAFGLMAFDIAFNADLSENIAFGNATFVYPPATEETRGVARIATQARVDAVADGEDDAETIVTPMTLRARLAAFATAVNASLVAIGETITALTARTITGAGLVTGGGSLAANRVLTVTEASAADITAGTATDKVVTPRRLGPIAMTLAQNGFIRFFGFQIVWGRATVGANSSAAVSFVEEFPTACFACVASGTNDTAVDSKDNWPAVNPATITPAGFSVISADDASQTFSYIAVGH